MSVYYSRKRKKWRYEFTIKGKRFTGTWYQKKSQAKEAEYQRKEEIRNPKPKMPTDMEFLDLVNRRLDYVKAYNSASHYRDYVSMSKRWAKHWKKKTCSEITMNDIQEFMIKRKKVSAFTANKDLRYLRATFNFGIRYQFVDHNPTQGIPFFPIEKRPRYVPSKEDVMRVFMAAEPDTKDYLMVIRDTLARMGEVNRLAWEDVDLDNRTVTLYTRKKRGGHLTPRWIPMTKAVYEVLSRRFKQRDKTKPWVFWHRYWSRKEKKYIEGPFDVRNKIMTTLCKRAGVQYFRYHALRHFGASLLDNANAPIGSIQRILGHENRTTTEIYLHSLGEAERNTMELFEREIEKSHTNPHTNEKGANHVLANPL